MTDEPGVVARWEWRTFGDDLGEAGERLAAMTPERVVESDETYLLSVDAEASVKLRDGVLDVKLLQGVDDNGLQQWRPVLKVSEPFGPDDIRTALAALGAASLPVDEAETSFGRLVDEIVDPAPGLAAVPVHKHRRRLTVGGCMAELTDVRAGHAQTRTIAIEAEDPALVLGAVRELGLALRPNVSFPQGLAALVGLGARRFAVVDVGTNSIKFHVAERAADGTWRAIADGAEVTRLGEGLHESGRLGDEPIARTVAALAAVADQVRGHGAESIAAVGTAGLRIASNRDVFLDAARERAGVDVEVISGEEEARLAFVAVTAGLDIGDGPVAVFDTGGGSSQFTFASGGRIEEQFSVNVGAARITERFGLDAAISEEELAAALAALGDELAALDGRPVPRRSSVWAAR